MFVPDELLTASERLRSVKKDSIYAQSTQGSVCQLIMIELTNINSPIAEDVWDYIDSDGNERSSKIIVGKPEMLKKMEWYCPVSIENYTDRIVPAYGIGPVDALMNAMILVKSFFDRIHSDKESIHD